MSVEYLEKIKNGECYLADIPSEYITEEICLESVKRSGEELEWVPEKFKTYRMCIVAALNFRYSSSRIYIPTELRKIIEADIGLII